MTKRSARLELTWQNKDRRLLSHGAQTYEWVDLTDWRVSEVRLLHPTGEVGKQKKGQGNLLVQGDALHALNALVELPELRKEYLGKVKLCYIDPPFNTGQTFVQYDDAVEHSVWLTMLRDRLIQIKKLLSDDGSVWLHLDDAESHRARCVLDEVFGAENFVATIVWQKMVGRDNRTHISKSHDSVHVYARDLKVWKNTRNLLPRTDEAEERYSNPDNDPRGDWTSGDMSAKAGPGRRAEQFYEITLPSGRKVNPSSGRCWLFTQERYEEMIADNRIWFGETGNNMPRIKRFRTEVQDGLVPTTWWTAEEVGTNDSAKKEIKALIPGITPFETPKPERLIEQIVQIGSNPGDIVLDCFAGSGTTAAVAHKMDRRWVTVELSEGTVAEFVEPRLAKVIAGEDPGGITEAVGWTGGGGYSKYTVGPSMFEDVDGVIALADWVTGGDLGVAVAAQLGYDLMDQAPFVGIKGRSRLAVIDGMATTGIVDYLLAHLIEGERLHLVAQALEPGLTDYVKSKRPGSRAQKVPKDLAHVSKRTATVTLQTETTGGGKNK